MVIAPVIFKRKHPRIRDERIRKESIKRWESWKQLQNKGQADESTRTNESKF